MFHFKSFKKWEDFWLGGSWCHSFSAWACQRWMWSLKTEEPNMSFLNETQQCLDLALVGKMHSWTYIQVIFYLDINRTGRRFCVTFGLTVNIFLALWTGCRSLTDDLQARLALKFANCFLEKSGMKGYPCPDDKEVPLCLEGISNNGFNTYSNFFTVRSKTIYSISFYCRWQEIKCFTWLFSAHSQHVPIFAM